MVANVIPTWRNISTSGIQKATENVADSQDRFARTVGQFAESVGDIAQGREDYRTQQEIDAVNALQQTGGELNADEVANLQSGIAERQEGSIFGARQSDIDEALRGRKDEAKSEFLKEQTFKDKKLEIESRGLIAGFESEFINAQPHEMNEILGRVKQAADAGKMLPGEVSRLASLAETQSQQEREELKSIWDLEDQGNLRKANADLQKRIAANEQAKITNETKLKDAADELNRNKDKIGFVVGADINSSTFSYNPTTGDIMMDGKPIDNPQLQQFVDDVVVNDFKPEPVLTEDEITSDWEKGLNLSNQKDLNDLVTGRRENVRLARTANLLPEEQQRRERFVAAAENTVQKQHNARKAKLANLKALTAGADPKANAEAKREMLSFGAEYGVNAAKMGSIIDEISSENPNTSNALIMEALTTSITDDGFLWFSDIDANKEVWKANVERLATDYAGRIRPDVPIENQQEAVAAIDAEIEALSTEIEGTDVEALKLDRSKQADDLWLSQNAPGTTNQRFAGSSIQQRGNLRNLGFDSANAPVQDLNVPPIDTEAPAPETGTEEAPVEENIYLADQPAVADAVQALKRIVEVKETGHAASRNDPDKREATEEENRFLRTVDKIESLTEDIAKKNARLESNTNFGDKWKASQRKSILKDEAEIKRLEKNVIDKYMKGQ